MESSIASSGREAIEGPSSSSGAAVTHQAPPLVQPRLRQQLSRYESQKRRDWNTFQQHLKNLKPPVSLARCAGAHVIEFMKYLDQFGKTKVHAADCAYFGLPNPPAPCACPLKQAWGSLDALVGRLRAAYDENGCLPESNPFGTKAVRIYLREVRVSQAKARGIPYEKKRKRRPLMAMAIVGAGASTSHAAVNAIVASVSSKGTSTAIPSAPRHATATLSPTTTDGSSTAAAVPADGR